MGEGQSTRWGRHAAARVGLVCTAVTAFVAFAAVALATLVTASASIRAAGAAGILPPDNPLTNIAPGSADYLTSIDVARADEGVGPMAVSESVVSSLPVPEQAFIVINEERIDRGLPPIEYVTAQLNADAQQGAAAGDDPGFPAQLTGGSPLMWGGSVWAGGLSSVFGADYYWMYSDGFGGTQGATSNADCSAASPSGCWGHRDILLHEFSSCGTTAPTLAMGAALSATGTSGGSIAAVVVGTCGAAPTDVTLTWSQVESMVSPPRVVGLAALPDGRGYWEAESDGAVVPFGAAPDDGSMADAALNSPIVGIEPTVDGGGYWLVAADGGVFSFGDAQFLGSMGGHPLNRPIVGMAADPATGGYWLVAADGGIFSFDAPFFGSTGNLSLSRPVVGMEALPDGQGYRFEAADGGVFCFGAATFTGSMGGHELVAPVVGMVSDQAEGYWLVAGDGGIFTFGGASYYGRITG